MKKTIIMLTVSLIFCTFIFAGTAYAKLTVEPGERTVLTVHAGFPSKDKEVTEGYIYIPKTINFIKDLYDSYDFHNDCQNGMGFYDNENISNNATGYCFCEGCQKARAGLLYPEGEMLPEPTNE